MLANSIPPVQISIGCVRARFAKHIAVLILIDACASAVGFYLLGFAFAFGDKTDADGNLAGNQVGGVGLGSPRRLLWQPCMLW
jgi:ammonia channel protein AmtB